MAGRLGLVLDVSLGLGLAVILCLTPHLASGLDLCLALDLGLVFWVLGLGSGLCETLGFVFCLFAGLCWLSILVLVLFLVFSLRLA